jgi:hypothetical protein
MLLQLQKQKPQQSNIVKKILMERGIGILTEIHSNQTVIKRLELMQSRLGWREYDEKNHGKDMAFIANELMDLIDILVTERRKSNE